MHTTTMPESRKRLHLCEGISFSEEDLDSIVNPHEDLLTIQIDIGKYLSLYKVMVDNGSSVDILYLAEFEKMDFKKEKLASAKETIYRFTNTKALVVWAIDLEVFMGKRNGRVSRTTHFIVIDINSLFNEILGIRIHGFKAIPSSYHHCFKYPGKDGKMATVFRI